LEVERMIRAEDARVLRAARCGDRAARARIVAEHLDVLRAIAAHYRDLGLPVDDLVQEGSIGLLDAIDRYDAQRAPDFETYARFRIRRAIRNALTEQSRIIRLPKQVVERRRAIDRAEADLAGAKGHLPTPAELAAATGLSRTTVIATRSLPSNLLSLDEPILADGSTLEAVVADAAARDPELEAVDREAAHLVDDAVTHLPDRQREIVTRHFGLGRDAEQIPEVAAALHVSQQRARAIERDALYSLRERLDPLVTRPATR
jgi:RNA polymerase sigma factor (sigma-70 family)